MTFCHWQNPLPLALLPAPIMHQSEHDSGSLLCSGAHTATSSTSHVIRAPYQVSTRHIIVLECQIPRNIKLSITVL